MPEENIWDPFAQWDKVAKLDKIEDVKMKIAGPRVWRPNYVPPALEYVFGYVGEEMMATGTDVVPAVVDFGCGLGRNGQMLSRYFPRVVGVDLPQMIERVKTEFPSLLGNPYSQLYGSVTDLVASESICALYDSVVFQHIVDSDYISKIIDVLSTQNSFRTIVSVYYQAGARAPFLDVLKKYGWRVWHSEVEVLSFEGAPHNITVFRRG